MDRILATEMISMIQQARYKYESLMFNIEMNRNVSVQDNSLLRIYPSRIVYSRRCCTHHMSKLARPPEAYAIGFMGG